MNRERSGGLLRAALACTIAAGGSVFGQCPDLQGTYYCPPDRGVPAETLTIRQSTGPTGATTYAYVYSTAPDDPILSIASGEGVLNTTFEGQVLQFMSFCENGRAINCLCDDLDEDGRCPEAGAGKFRQEIFVLPGPRGQKTFVTEHNGKPFVRFYGHALCAPAKN